MKRYRYELNHSKPKAMVLAILILWGGLLGQAKKISVDVRKQLFNDDWKFCLGDASEAKSPEYDDHSWRQLDLPHDWSIEGVVHPKNPSGNAGGYFPAGIGWYRKTFEVPAEANGKCISIYFEGVYMNAELYINGHLLGNYPYGYSSFSYDITPYLAVGKSNVLAVKVDNSQHLNSRWYSGSGIYRNVWLMVTDPVHVAQWGVAVTTLQASAKKATVQVNTLVVNETAFSQQVSLKTTLIDKNNKVVGSQLSKVELPANGEKELTQTIGVSHPLVWSPEMPNLYRAKIQVVRNGQIIDNTTSSLGIRSIEFSAEKGFLLNGKQVKLNGGCVHHDNGCLGAAAYNRAEERKIELLKAAGFNAVRTSHNPPSEAFLDACDRLGLMVMDESFDCWKVGKNKHDYSEHFNQWWTRDLEAMVKRDRNHPSIIMWSIGNEIPERGSADAVQTAQMLVDAIKRIDASRPVTSAVVVNDKKWEAFDSLFAAHDVAGYNYHLYSAVDDHKRISSRMIVHTESYPKDAFANWALVHDNNHVLGDFVWTAMDYLGESGLGRWYYSGETPGENWDHDMFPWHGAYCGDIDLIGWRKPVSHYRSLLYNNTAKLYMAVREPEPSPREIKETWWSVWPTWESWTWPGFEGKEVQVEVYSKYPKVRLYLNNNLVGEQPTTREQGFKATFAVPYTAGLLKAVGVDDGKEIESTTLQTAGEAAKINLLADRNEITADGQDLVFATVQLTDKDGVPQPNAANRLHFSVKGPGVIVGVGNADLQDFDPYVGSTRKAWKGRALVVIKSTRVAGDVKLTVSSQSLSNTEIVIRSIALKK